MSERDAVDAVDTPATVTSLVSDLRAIGLSSGDLVLVHSSLSALGWVVGGPVAVVQALIEVITEGGTIVMPTHSSQCSEPRHWENPAVPGSWHATSREHAPAFDPNMTPTREMGAIPDVFRTLPEARRSAHPTDSFAAWGAERDAIVAEHPLDFPLGDGGPLGRIYERRGKVLLLGVGHERNTSLHLAEHRWGRAATYQQGAAVLGEHGREWATWQDYELDTGDFDRCGAELDELSETRVGPVGGTTARLLDQARLVDFAANWFARHRATGAGLQP